MAQEETMSPNTLDQLPEFARVPEVARVLGMSATQCWRMVWSGELPSIRLSERLVRIPRRQLAEWVEARLTPAATI
jgi:excisionase family DNA binding protein